MILTRVDILITSLAALVAAAVTARFLGRDA